MPFPKEITRYCPSFVSLTYSNDAGGMTEVIKIQLAHFSVQEYFQSDRLEPALGKQLNKTAAAAALLDLCLSYLLELNPSLPLGETKGQYPFVEFAAQYWWDYAAVMEASNQIVRDTLKEYYASQDAFTLGCKFYSPDGFPRYEGDGRAVSPLYYTSVAGLLASVHFLLRTVVDVHVPCLLSWLGQSCHSPSWLEVVGLVMPAHDRQQKPPCLRIHLLGHPLWLELHTMFM